MTKKFRKSLDLRSVLLPALFLQCASLGWTTEGYAATGTPAEVVLPQPAPVYTGHLGPTPETSSPPQFPASPTAPAGAPNILLVMTDDVGFGAASTFGGPVPTPNLDQLAARGLKYDNFHVTAICSSTRAALLTGRNHHAVGTGSVVDIAMGYPGYNSVIPKSAATIAEVLHQNGYNTAMFGKHHNTPRWLATAAGPFDTWPTGLGFDYFYGFIGGDDDQFAPTLYRNTWRVPTPNKPDYILDRDLADDAIQWIHTQKGAAPNKPFFIYLAPGTTHAPHQAPADWIAKFKNKFGGGWDAVRAETVARQKAMGILSADAAVTPRPADIPAWSSLTPDQQRLYARMMAVYAADLSHEDFQFGRVVNELARMGELDNTLVIFIEGDNGASAEGGLEGFTNEMGKLGNGVPESEQYKLSVIDELGGPKQDSNYPAGWTWAMDAPFPFFKQIASHLGGITNGMVVAWPKRIAPSADIRRQFQHVVDIAPTLYEVAGVKAPTSVNGVKQQKLDGVSLAYTFPDGGQNAAGRHTTQYFEMLGNKGIYHDGWFANTTPQTMPWSPVRRDGLAAGADYKWELYNLNTDFAQANDLSAQYPEKLASLRALWNHEAEENKVFPVIQGGSVARFNASIDAYGVNRPHSTFWGPMGMPEGAAPSLKSRSFTIKADVDLAAQPKGVILAVGGRFGGWSFYLDGKDIVAFDAFSQQPQHQYRVAAKAPGAGPATIQFDFDYDGGGYGKGGTMRISVNGVEQASGRMDHTDTLPQNSEEFDIGYDAGTPVSPEYTDEFPFNGKINKVELTLR